MKSCEYLLVDHLQFHVKQFNYLFKIHLIIDSRTMQDILLKIIFPHDKRGLVLPSAMVGAGLYVCPRATTGGLPLQKMADIMLKPNNRINRFGKI